MYFLSKEVLSLFKALDIIHENVVVLFEKRVALSFVLGQVIFSKRTFADVMPTETLFPETYRRKCVDRATR